VSSASDRVCEPDVRSASFWSKIKEALGA
jgi:hypothetical protein